MRYIAISVLVLWIGAATVCSAQQFEFGGVVGFARGAGLTANTATASANAGVLSGTVLGVVITDNMHRWLGGELRYAIQTKGFRVASGGQEVTLNGRSHLIAYDFLFYPVLKKAKVRPFFAAGTGARIYQGTGKAITNQPLRQFVRLANATEMQPIVSVGGGVKFYLKSHTSFRLEVHDYLTQPPKAVLVPATAATLSGWLHDVVPAVGVSYTF